MAGAAYYSPWGAIMLSIGSVGPALQTLDVSLATKNRSKILQKRFAALTTRRQQVAILAAHGLSNAAIAEKLDLTVGTVKSHLHATFKILDIRSRIELVTALLSRRTLKARF
jgi:DNA-binding NarL/FixJ family response regulator